MKDMKISKSWLTFIGVVSCLIGSVFLDYSNRESVFGITLLVLGGVAITVAIIWSVIESL